MIIFLKHQFLEAYRSLYWQSSMFINFLIGIIGLYFLANIVVIGWYSDVLIMQFYQKEGVVESFSGLLFFFFFFDFFARIMLQKLPVVSIQPYLTLHINKSKLFHYALLKSIPGFYNMISICLVIPFFIKTVLPTHSVIFSISWITTALALVFTNNFLIYSIKSKYSANPVISLIIPFFIVVLLYFNILDIYFIIEHFSLAFLFICNHPILIFVPLLFLGLSYYNSFRILKSKYYLEFSTLGFSKTSFEFKFLNNFGQIGVLISNELKMLLRSKRAWSSLLAGVFFVFYSFFLYSQHDIFFIQFFAGFFIVSIIALNYGQLIFAWESQYFDKFLTTNITLMNYLKSKYLIIALLTLVPYIISVAFFFTDIEMLMLLSAMMLYTIGVGSIILLFFGCFRVKGINPERGIIMNYEGFGAKDFLIIIPLLGIPVLFFFLFYQTGYTRNVLYGIGVTGLLGIIFSHQMLKLIENIFKSRKHTMARGFRNL